MKTIINNNINVMKKITKKNMAQFVKSIEQILVDNGFRKTIPTDKYFRYEWVKETNDFGNVYFHPDKETDTKVYSIFGMFEDVEKAKNIGNHLFGGLINPYSGKCNFHYYDIDYTIDQFKNFLQKINS